jgi:integrase
MSTKTTTAKSNALTDAEVRALEAPARGRIAKADPSLPGFHVRVTSTGEKSLAVWWRVPKRFGGEERKGLVTLGSYPATSLESARTRAKKILDDAKAGRDPREVVKAEAEAEARRKRESEAHTLQAVVRAYLDDRKPRLRPATIRDYELSFTAYLEGTELGRTLIGDVSRRAVREYVRTLSRERGPSIGRRMHSMIRSVMRWAADEEIVALDALASLRFEHSQPVRDRVLSDEEIATLWHALDDVPPLVACAVRLQLLTATRYPSEPLSLEWRHLTQTHLQAIRDASDEPVPTWEIPAEHRKRGIAHVAPLSPQAVAILDQMKPLTGNKPHVFEGLTEGLMMHWWKKTRRRVMEETSGASFCHHDLRRTAATGCAKTGSPPYVVERVLGHKERGIGPTYNKWEYLREKYEAVCRWSAHVERIVAPRAGASVTHLEARA